MFQHAVARRLAASLTLASLAFATPAQAGFEDQMNSMFNDLGMVGNVTGPGAYRGQTTNVYTGGSLMVRAPIRNYQLYNVEWPSIKAGCNGIDAFAGSFSHISAAAFKDMLKKITAALPGVAFQLALSSVTPLLGQKVEWVKWIEQALTMRNVNSCEAAQMLVGSAAKQMGYSRNAACRRAAVWLGRAEDEDDAGVVCKDAQDDINTQAANSGDKRAKDAAPFVGNFTWTALKRVQSLTDDEREMLMNITGVVIFPQGGDTDYKPPTITDLGDLMYGNGDLTASATGTRKMSLLSCNNYVSCDQVSIVQKDFTPLVTRVENLMTSLASKIRNKDAAPDVNEVALVNNTSLPVYRLLAVGTTGQMALEGQLIGQYRDTIAADYAAVLIDNAVHRGIAALMNRAQLDSAQSGYVNNQTAYLHAMLNKIGQSAMLAQTKQQSFVAVTQHLELLQRELRTKLPAHVADMLAYARDAGR